MPTPNPPEPAYGRASWLTGIVLLLTVASALRAPFLDGTPFWYDEYCSIVTAWSPKGILGELRDDPNAPFYFLILKGWMSLFGSGETAVRSLSAVLGVAQVGCLGLLMRSCGAPRSAALWAMALCALAPLQIYYSVEARPYMLGSLLGVVSLWSLLRSMDRGLLRFWLLHGLFTTLAVYTNNLTVFLFPAAWAALALRRPPKWAWKRLAVVHALALALWAPWLPSVFDQLGASTGYDWVRHFWEATPPAWAIPRSLELFGMGGRFPAYLNWPSPPAWASILSVSWFALLAAFAVTGRPLHRPRPEDPERPGGRGLPRDHGRLGSAAAVLIAYALSFLLPLFLYSIVRKPIYLVGRYEFFAQVYYLGFAALGLWGLQRLLARVVPPAAATVLPLLVLAILGWHSVAPRAQLPAAETRNTDKERARHLSRFAQSDDLVVALDYAAAGFISRRRNHPTSGEFITFPSTVRERAASITPRGGVGEPEEEALRQEARRLLREFRQAGPAGKTLWLVYSGVSAEQPLPRQGENGWNDVFRILLGEASALGYRTAYPNPELRQSFAEAFLLPLQPDPAARP